MNLIKSKYEVHTEDSSEGGQCAGMRPIKLTVKDPDSGISISVDDIYRISRSQVRTINDFKEAIDLLKQC